MNATPATIAAESITEYEVVILGQVSDAYEALRASERTVAEAAASSVGTGGYSYHLAGLLKDSQTLDTLVYVARSTGLVQRIGTDLWTRIASGESLRAADFEAAGVPVVVRQD